MAMAGDDIMELRRQAAEARTLPSSHIVKVNLSGTKLAIPIGYFDVRPPISKVEAGLSGDWINFSFWMPGGRPPEVETFYHPGYQPPEPGRPAPKPDEHVVKVVQFRNHPLDKPGFVAPEQMHRNRVSVGPEYAYHPYHGFIRFRPTSGPNDRWIYKHSDGSDIHFIIDCYENVVIPSCKGWVYDLKQSISYHVIYPRGQLVSTLPILRQVRELFTSWKR